MALSDEAKERLSVNETDQLYRTIRTALWCATVAFIFWTGFKSFESFAGQDTKLSLALTLVLQAFAELKVTLLITLSGGASIWALAERAVRHRKTEKMQARIKELELRLDPNRTGSNLTPHGKTNPGDLR